MLILEEFKLPRKRQLIEERSDPAEQDVKKALLENEEEKTHLLRGIGQKQCFI